MRYFFLLLILSEVYGNPLLHHLTSGLSWFGKIRGGESKPKIHGSCIGIDLGTTYRFSTVNL